MTEKSIIDVYKPKATRSVFKYGEVMRWLGAKYEFDQHNFSNYDGRHFDRWRDAKGYAQHGYNTPEEVKRSQAMFTEYSNDPKGLPMEPERQNFWHWIIDHIGLDTVVHKKSFVLHVADILGKHDTEVAPTLQAEKDENYKAMIATLERVAPEGFAKMFQQQNKPPKADLPDFVKTVLGYLRTEFGDTIKFKVEST